MSGDVPADAPDGFALPRQVLSLLDGFGKPWWVAGGWAVDLFVGRPTRPHKDIEIAQFRNDQSACRNTSADGTCARWWITVWSPGSPASC